MIKSKREAAVMVKNSSSITRLVKLASSGLGYLLSWQYSQLLQMMVNENTLQM